MAYPPRSAARTLPKKKGPRPGWRCGDLRSTQRGSVPATEAAVNCPLCQTSTTEGARVPRSGSPSIFRVQDISSLPAMQTVLPDAAALYPRLLGASWGALDEAICRLHTTGVGMRAAGTFRIRH